MKKIALTALAALALAAPTSAQAHVYKLFSHPAQHHPKMSAPPKLDIECQVTNGGLYEVCCVWNPDESPYMPGVGVLPIIGAWDCTAKVVE